MKHQIDHLDKKILKLISQNARIPFLEVARECNVSGAAIHQRVQKLINLGVIKGSQFVIDTYKIGYQTCAYIGINIKDMSLFNDVIAKIRAIPEIVECHYTTGKYAVLVKVYAKDGSIYVYTPNREEVVILNMTGAIVKSEEQVGLVQYDGLERGIYIIRIGDNIFKIKN